MASGRNSGSITWTRGCDLRYSHEIGAMHNREPATNRFHADHAEAVIGLGDLAWAEVLVQRMEVRASALPRPWINAVSARCRGLLHAAAGDLDAALEDYQLTLAAGLAITLAACSSNSSTSTQTTGPPRTVGTSIASAAVASTSASSSSSTPVAASGLSGKWSGHYSGSSQGDFTLNWSQSGSALIGTIKLAADGSSLPIHGTTNGDSIQFGTVGATGITYKGTVSGNPGRQLGPVVARRQDIGRGGNRVASVDHRLISADIVNRQGDPDCLGR